MGFGGFQWILGFWVGFGDFGLDLELSPSWEWEKSTDQPTRSSGTSELPSFTGRFCVTCGGKFGIWGRERLKVAPKIPKRPQNPQK